MTSASFMVPVTNLAPYWPPATLSILRGVSVGSSRFVGAGAAAWGNQTHQYANADVRPTVGVPGLGSRHAVSGRGGLYGMRWSSGWTTRRPNIPSSTSGPTNVTIRTMPASKMNTGAEIPALGLGRYPLWGLKVGEGAWTEEGRTRDVEVPDPGRCCREGCGARVEEWLLALRHRNRLRHALQICSV